MLIKVMKVADLVKLCTPTARANLDLEPLIKSFKENGFTWDTEESNGIRVLGGHSVTDGARRIYAAAALKWDTLPVVLVDAEVGAPRNPEEPHRGKRYVGWLIREPGDGVRDTWRGVLGNANAP